MILFVIDLGFTKPICRCGFVVKMTASSFIDDGSLMAGCVMP